MRIEPKKSREKKQKSCVLHWSNPFMLLDCSHFENFKSKNFWNLMKVYAWGALQMISRRRNEKMRCKHEPERLIWRLRLDWIWQGLTWKFHLSFHISTNLFWHVQIYNMRCLWENTLTTLFIVVVFQSIIERKHVSLLLHFELCL